MNTSICDQGIQYMHVFGTPLIISLLLLALLSVAAVLTRLISGQRGNQIAPGAYEAQPAFFSPAERSFFGVLQQALAEEYQIFAKVRLADIIKPVRNLSRRGWQSAFNRVAGKHIDFVLCDLGSLAVVAVIELDDQTHQRLERSTRDNLVDSALADAHIPVLRVTARESYSPSQIREKLTLAINMRQR